METASAEHLKGRPTILRGLALTLAFFLPGILGVASVFAARALPRSPLEVVNPSDCPIHVIGKKSRVGPSHDSDRWARLREGAKEDATPSRSGGPGKAQRVFEVAFENRSDKPCVSIAFLWEAFDAEGAPVYRRMTVFSGETLRPGRARSVHELDLEPSGPRAERFRLSVLRVTFEDGSVWSNPSATGAEETATPKD